MKKFLSMLLVLCMVVTTLMGVMVVDVSAKISSVYTAATDTENAKTEITLDGSATGGSRFFRSGDVYIRVTDSDSTDGSGYTPYEKWGTLSNSDYMGMNFNHAVAEAGSVTGGDPAEKTTYWGLCLTPIEANVNNTTSSITGISEKNTSMPSMTQEDFTKNVTNGNVIHFTTYAYSDITSGETFTFQMTNISSSVGTFNIYIPNLYSADGVPHKIDFFVYSDSKDETVFGGSDGEYVYIAAYLDGRYYGGMKIEESASKMTATEGKYVYFMVHKGYSVSATTGEVKWNDLKLHWQTKLGASYKQDDYHADLYTKDTLTAGVEGNIFETLDTTKLAGGTVRTNVVSGVANEVDTKLESALKASIQKASEKVGASREISFAPYYKYIKNPSLMYTDGYDNSNVKIVDKTTGKELTSDEVAALDSLDSAKHLLSVNGVYVVMNTTLPTALSKTSLKLTTDDEASVLNRKILFTTATNWVPNNGNVTSNINSRINTGYGSWYHKGWDYNEEEIGSVGAGNGALVADGPTAETHFLDVTSTTVMGKSAVMYDYKPSILIDDSYKANGKKKVTANYLRLLAFSDAMNSTSLGEDGVDDISLTTTPTTDDDGNETVTNSYEAWETDFLDKEKSAILTFYAYTKNVGGRGALESGDVLTLNTTVKGSSVINSSIYSDSVESGLGIPHKVDVVYSAKTVSNVKRVYCYIYIDGVLSSVKDVSAEAGNFVKEGYPSEPFGVGIYNQLSFDGTAGDDTYVDRITVTDTDWVFLHDGASSLSFETVSDSDLANMMFTDISNTDTFRTGYITGVDKTISAALESILSTATKGDKILSVYTDVYSNPAAIFDSDANTASNVSFVNKNDGTVYEEGADLGGLTFADLYMVVNGVYIAVEDAGASPATYDASTGAGTINVDGVAAGDAVVVVAGYSALGKTEDVKVSKVTIAEGDTSKEFTAALELDTGVTVKYYKIFLFDSITNAKPLKECVVIE